MANFRRPGGPGRGAGNVCLPLQLGAIRLGVLDLYRDAPGPLSPDAITDALTAADIVCLALLGRIDDQNQHPDDLAAEWADRSVLDRAEVHQATGMVMARLGITADEALSRLRAFAFAEGMLLSTVAADVVARRLRLDPN